MSTEPPDELEPAVLQQKQKFFTFNMGCFPTLCIIFVILAIFLLYPIVTHPPIDYVYVALILVSLCVPLLLFTPRLRPLSNRRPLLASSLVFTPLTLIAVYPVVIHPPVDYMRLLQVLLAYIVAIFYIRLFNMPVMRTIVSRYPVVSVPIIILVACVSSILYNVYPHPDYSGLFWTCAGIIVSLIWLGVLWRRVRREGIV